MNQEQFAALVAAGMSPTAIGTNVNAIMALLGAGQPPAVIAAMFSAQTTAPATTSAPAPASGLLGALRKAPDPNKSGQSFNDDNGKYDGDYAVTVKYVGTEQKKKGQICRTVLQVDESSNALVGVGSEREYVLFLWNDPAVSEMKGWIQTLSDAKGNVGDFSDAFYLDALGEKQICAGLRFHLKTFTTPQKQNKLKQFTHHRFSPISAGESLGIATTTATTATAPASVAPVTPPSVPGGAAYAPAGVTATPMAGPPPGFPPTVQWPTETPEQWAARKAAAGVA